MKKYTIVAPAFLILIVLCVVHISNAHARFDEEPQNKAVYNFNSQNGSARFIPIRDALITEDGQRTPMLDELTPNRFRVAINKYTRIEYAGGWTEIPQGQPIYPGRWDARVGRLRNRLIEEGYIDHYQTDQPTKYDKILSDAIRQFQYNHGLRASGIVDEQTTRQLNIPPQYIINKLKVNLPRVQEYAKNLTPNYVVVNVPAQTLEAVENGDVYSRHNVITGSIERPTPMISSTITQLNFNPYWHIPKSIVERDILPRIRRNPNLLKLHNIRVFESYNGSELDTEFINWNTVTADQYHFRQEPGRHNAMDSVRINFFNRYSVYLHDTPQKALFSQAGRYISSGCVRVDQIHILTEWLLRGNQGWTKEHIKGIVESRERFDTKINRNIALRLVYITAWVDRNGIASLRADPYDLDETDFVFGQPQPVEIGKIENKKNFAEKKSPQEGLFGQNLGQIQSEKKYSEKEQNEETLIDHVMSISTSISGFISESVQ